MKPSAEHMQNLRSFISPFTREVVDHWFIADLVVDENVSVGGPMTFLFKLCLSEDMPSKEHIEEICEKHRNFPFPFIIEIPERQIGWFTVAVAYNS